MLPGARLVFTQGFEFKPFSLAFLATSPAAISTFGFEVFVQLVMAAITTDPFCNLLLSNSKFFFLSLRKFLNELETFFN